MLAARFVAIPPSALATGFGKAVSSVSKNSLSGRNQCVRW